MFPIWKDDLGSVGLGSQNKDLNIFVGMSGGVDSAVAALLLRQQGYQNVTGVFMKNWDEKDEQGICSATQDYDDVRRICNVLDIPYYTVNFEKEYWDRVFQIFLEEYRYGRTPNPDILCNREIKFAAFLDFALRNGADCLATGHYAGVDCIDGRYRLLKAADQSKDQTYFLAALSQKALSHAMFPLAGLQKKEVRALAEKYGIPVAKKKDSTGVCFIGERNFKQFLSTYLPAQPGEIKTSDGKTVGKHDGLMYYTLGQRRGLGIGGGGTGERWFVIQKDLENNILYVQQGEGKELLSRHLIVKSINWIRQEMGEELYCSAKVRYRQSDQKCRINRISSGYIVEFEQMQRAVTPGQWIVLYNQNECLGGGVIEQIIK